jgi:hypothetical protein
MAHLNSPWENLDKGKVVGLGRSTPSLFVQALPQISSLNLESISPLRSRSLPRDRSFAYRSFPRKTYRESSIKTTSSVTLPRARASHLPSGE